MRHATCQMRKVHWPLSCVLLSYKQTKKQISFFFFCVMIFLFVFSFFFPECLHSCGHGHIIIMRTLVNTVDKLLLLTIACIFSFGGSEHLLNW